MTKIIEFEQNFTEIWQKQNKVSFLVILKLLQNLSNSQVDGVGDGGGGCGDGGFGGDGIFGDIGVGVDGEGVGGWDDGGGGDCCVDGGSGYFRGGGDSDGSNGSGGDGGVGSIGGILD